MSTKFQKLIAKTEPRKRELEEVEKEEAEIKGLPTRKLRAILEQPDGEESRNTHLYHIRSKHD